MSPLGGEVYGLRNKKIKKKQLSLKNNSVEGLPQEGARF